MRAAAIAVVFSLASASVPADAAAQIRAIKPITISQSVLSVGGAGLSSSFSAPLPLMTSPSLSPSLNAAVGAAPTLQAAASPATLSPAAAPLALPLAVRVESARALTQSLPDVPVSAAPAAAARSFSILTGEAPARRDESLTVLSAPSVSEPPSLPPSTPRERPASGERFAEGESNPEAVKNVRRMLLGTAAIKTGMETVTLSIPLLALSAFGGISAVAGLVVVYGLAQTVFAGMAGGLADRFPAHKVLAAAIVAQAVLVGVVVALGAFSALSAATLIPVYILIGGAVGIAETTRHSIPALILGQDGAALSKYNARLHISYESAGVAGALAAGALIAFAGPLWSLLIQPPAYLLAAYFFLRVRHGRPAGLPAAAAGGVWDKIKAYAADAKAGAKLVLGDGRLRWVALAFVLPQIVHRVFESLMIPVFAKTILAAPQASAWLLTASNMGELLGAVLLLKFASRFKGPAVWVKYGALGLLLIWTLASTTALPILLPLILISSLTWAASDLGLRSEVQSTVAEKDQPRALSFLYGAQVLGSAAASFALGAVLDALGAGPAMYWICGGISALALSVFIASRRLKK